MNQREAIVALLNNENKSQAWLAEKMEYSKPSGVSQMLRRGNITVDTLLRICDLLEYEVTIQPKRRAGSRPNGQIVIEREEAV